MSIAAKCDCGKEIYYCGGDCPKANPPIYLPSPPDCSKGNEAEREKMISLIERFCEAITSYKIQKEENPRNKGNGLIHQWNKIAAIRWEAYKFLSTIKPQ